MWQPENEEMERERMDNLLKRQETFTVLLSLAEALIEKGSNAVQAVDAAILAGPKLIDYVDKKHPLEEE